MKRILKLITFVIIGFCIVTLGRFIFIELKYFNPRFIKDKNSEYTLKRTDWTFINHKEKVSEYTRIDSVIYCGEIACNFPPMKDVDIESFEILPGTDYARDKNNGTPH